MSFASREDQVFVSSPGSSHEAPRRRFEPQRCFVISRAIRTFVTACSAGAGGTGARGPTIGGGRVARGRGGPGAQPLEARRRAEHADVVVRAPDDREACRDARPGEAGGDGQDRAAAAHVEAGGAGGGGGGLLLGAG